MKKKVKGKMASHNPVKKSGNPKQVEKPVNKTRKDPAGNLPPHKAHSGQNYASENPYGKGK